MAFPWKAVWKFAGIIHGALYVMKAGVSLMLEWHADSWDTLQQVNLL